MSLENAGFLPDQRKRNEESLRRQFWIPQTNVSTHRHLPLCFIYEYIFSLLKVHVVVPLTVHVPPVQKVVPRRCRFFLVAVLVVVQEQRRADGARKVVRVEVAPADGHAALGGEPRHRAAARGAVRGVFWGGGGSGAWVCRRGAGGCGCGHWWKKVWGKVWGRSAGLELWGNSGVFIPARRLVWRPLIAAESLSRSLRLYDSLETEAYRLSRTTRRPCSAAAPG